MTTTTVTTPEVDTATTTRPPVVTASEWEVTSHDDRWLGLVCLRRDRFRAMCSTWRKDAGSVTLLDASFDTLAEAVAAIVEAKQQ